MERVANSVKLDDVFCVREKIDYFIHVHVLSDIFACSCSERNKLATSYKTEARRVEESP